MDRTLNLILAAYMAALACGCSGEADKPAVSFQPGVESALRAPAYPLVTVDPYTSVWSFSGNLYGDVARHWTGKAQPLLGALRVDGQVYRFMGVDSAVYAAAAVQKSVNALPVQTYYTFECGPVLLDVIFTSPLLMDDLDLMSRPVNYFSYQASSADGKSHDVQIYVEATPQWAVDKDSQAVRTGSESRNGIKYLSAGTESQNVLGRKGDDVRIDWGYFYLAAQEKGNVAMCIGRSNETRESFSESGKIAPPDGTPSPDAHTPMAYSCDLGKISAAPKSGFLMIGYDDLYSIQYFGDNRQAYWKRNGRADIFQAFEAALKDYEQVMERCGRFNVDMMAEADSLGGKKYAELCALAYRQAVAAHKLVTDKDGNLLFLSKENLSNGSIGTIDVTYPSSPLFLAYNTELMKGMLTPIFYYSESGQWKKPFAAHDVGTYPLANGQTYGGDMPVEETGNMLILTAAIAMIDGNAGYAEKHWETLTTWADYLMKEGFDPANQLCTDDFAGHLARNTNLSIKAIMGIAGYGKLASMLGDGATAEKYISAAREMAAKWVKMADDGGHYRLTFDGKGTWSQKYNLIWDRLFGLNLFPPEVAAKEMAHYRAVQQKYGLPLDSRKTYSKTDWIMWTACLTGDPEDFHDLMAHNYDYINETPVRVPITDWFETTDAQPINMRARSVVGGYFMKMLENKMLGK